MPKKVTATVVVVAPVKGDIDVTTKTFSGYSSAADLEQPLEDVTAAFMACGGGRRLEVASRRLEAVKALQTVFWSELRKLEVETGMDFENAEDFGGLTLADLRKPSKGDK